MVKGRASSAGRMAFGLLVAAAMSAGPPLAQAQPGSAVEVRVGAEVILMHGTSLEPDSRHEKAVRHSSALHSDVPVEQRSYRVAEVNQGRLWLVCDGEEARGWVPAGGVVTADRAIDYISSRIRAVPLDSSNYAWRGANHADAGEYEKAVADFSEAIRLDPRDVRARLGRAFAWRYQGEYDEAIADLDEAARIAPDNAGVYFDRSVVWLARGERTKALEDLDRVLRLAPKAMEPYVNRSLIFIELREYDRAIADLGQAIRLNPESAPAYLSRGNAWRERRDYPRAFADYDQAIGLAPGLGAAYLNRGLARHRSKDYAGAIADYDAAIRLEPGLAMAYNNRAITHKKKGDFRAAIADFDVAVRLAPKFPQPYCNRALLLAACPDSKLRDGKKALADAEEACTLTSYKEPHCLSSLAAAYAELGDFDKAAAFAARANKLFPDPEDRTEGERALKSYQARKPCHDED